MKCPYCEQEIPDGSTVCPICEKELMQGRNDGEIQEEVQTEVPPEGRNDAEAFDAKAAEGAEEAEKTEQTEAVPAVVKKKSSKGWIAGGVAAVAVVAALAFWQLNREDPKDTVIKAFEGVFAEGQTNPSEEIFGWKTMYDSLYETPYQMDMSLQLENFLGMTQFAGTGFSIEAGQDYETGASDMNLGIQYGGMPFMNAEFYLDDAELAVALPELTGKIFTLNIAEDMDAQLSASPYLGAYLSDMGFDIKGYVDYMKKVNELSQSGTQIFDVEALWERYKTGSSAIDSLKEAMTVEKGGKKNFTVDGKEQECTEYTVALPSAALVQFFTDTKDFFLEDETLRKDFVTYLDLVKDLNSAVVTQPADPQAGGEETLDEMTPEKQQEEIWTTVDGDLEEALAWLESSMGDLDLTVYVTDNGTLASFDYNTVFSEDTAAEETQAGAQTAAEEEKTAEESTAGETASVSGTVTLKGGYSRLANAEATLTVAGSEGAPVTVTVTKTGEYEKEQYYNGGLIIGFESEGEKGALNLSGSYQIADKSYVLKGTVENNGQEAGSLVVEGIMEELTPGESFKAAIDSIRVMVNDTLSDTGEASDPVTVLELSGSYGLAPLSAPIVKPEGENFDILAATEEEWNQVIMEIYLSFNSLLSGLNLS